MTSQRLKVWLCREYLPRVSAASTVSVGIARAYADQFNIPEPKVIRSIPNRCALPESPVDESDIKIIYHGLAGPGRGLEELISSISLWNPGRSLHLMIVESDRRYLAKLYERVEEVDRVEVIAPVAMREIVDRINEFDVGIYVNTAPGYQGQFAMPNKLFEYIQARLAVVVANSIEAGHLVTDLSCGVALSSTDPLDLAARLNSLTRDTVEEMKRASELAARSLCWENEEVKLLNVVKSVMAV